MASIGACCLGIAKTGFPGLALVNILIIAEIFGARASVGIILPMLILCDLIVYPLFIKYSSWKRVLPLLAPTLIGIAIGFLLLKAIDDNTARKLIGSIILIMLALQLMREYQKNFLTNLPDSKTFLGFSGLAIGTSTMIANAAGPVYSIYALVHKMSKEDFLGVGARFFLLVNLLKVPLLGSLSLINADSLKLNLLLIPGIILGIIAGRTLIKRIPQRIFEWLLYGFSLIAALRLLLV